MKLTVMATYGWLLGRWPMKLSLSNDRFYNIFLSYLHYSDIFDTRTFVKAYQWYEWVSTQASVTVSGRYRCLSETYSPPYRARYAFILAPPTPSQVLYRHRINILYCNPRGYGRPLLLDLLRSHSMTNSYFRPFIVGGRTRNTCLSCFYLRSSFLTLFQTRRSQRSIMW